jgi:hypothetical protein
MFPSLIKYLNIVAKEVHAGGVIDVCHVKFISLALGDLVLWNRSKYHTCDECVVPSSTTILDSTDNLIKIMEDIVNDEKYSKFITNNISTIIQQSTIGRV